jgi:hypothetical protein
MRLTPVAIDQDLYRTIATWFADHDYLSARYSTELNPDAISVLCSVHGRVMPVPEVRSAPEPPPKVRTMAAGA